MARDPVCGMEVDELSALSGVKNGAIYYFCSESCRSLFLGTEGKLKNEISSLKIRAILAFILSVPILFVPPLIQLLFVTPAMILGYQFFLDGISIVIKTRSATMDTLIALGTGTAYIYSIAGLFLGTHSYFEIASFLIAFILFGRWLEAVAKGRTSQAIQKLMGLGAKTAIVLKNGVEVEIPIEHVVVGDIVVVKPGKKIPVDGIVVEGYSNVDEALVTGESIPVQKNAGSLVIGGTINKFGSFRFSATKVGSETLLFQIIKFVEKAQISRAPIQKLTDKISSYFVPSVLTIGILSFAIWILLGMGLSFALSSFISVVIIACPCALGLATPTAVIVGTGIAAGKGILIKDAETLQRVESIDTVVFDKTGTITKGEPKVINISSHGSVAGDHLLYYAASLEAKSEHPLAEAVLAEAKRKNISLSPVADFNAFPGKGISGIVDGKKVSVGSSLFLAVQDNNPGSLFVAIDGVYDGYITVEDEPKDNANSVISILKKMGKEIFMITGDNNEIAKIIGAKVGIENIIAQVLPSEKSDKILQLQSSGKKVAFIGDGINDAPALAQADVGIALGSGTDIAIEAGEIILVKNDLADVVSAIKIGSYTMRKIRQNLFWAFFYNAIGIPIAAGVLYPFTGFLLNPIIAGVAMAFSSVSVVTNSILMRFFYRGGEN